MVRWKWSWIKVLVYHTDIKLAILISDMSLKQCSWTYSLKKCSEINMIPGILICRHCHANDQMT